MKKQKTRQQIRKFILIISFLLFPITINFFSPYLIIDGIIGGIITGSFFTFSIMFLTSLFFGRFICGWLCPAGGIGELCFQVQNKPVKGTKVNLIKYFIWVP